MRRVLFLLLLLCSTTLAAVESVEFALPGLDGKTHRLSDYRGKWVVVNFWATWCPPCLEEIPELIGFHDKHQEKLAVVLGINFEQVDRERLASFVDDQMISYPILLTDGDLITAFGPLQGLPTTIIVSPQGEIAGHYVGGIEAHMIEQFIEQEQLAEGGNS